MSSHVSPLVVYQFKCMALFHSQARRHIINLDCPINYKWPNNWKQVSKFQPCSNLRTFFYGKETWVYFFETVKKIRNEI